jgi:hypothetical protein
MKQTKKRRESLQINILSPTIILIIICLIHFHLLIGQTIKAQERRIIPFIIGGINFDGIPNEEVWKTLDSFPLVMHQPNNGKIPVQKTNVRLCYDEMYLYLGASMYYIDSKMITRIGKKRDYASWESDWIGIAIDTYNDKENMMLFAVNPNGIRTDATTMNDLINGMYDINFDFNTFWDAKISIKDNVWYSEIRIPLSSLRFQRNSDKVIMGIIILRANANTKNPDYGQSTFPEISQTKGDFLYWKASMGEEVEFIGLKSKKPVYMTPYVVGGVNRFYDENNSTAKNDYKLEAGVDFKYGLTNNLTLDVTANTDFAQVEADQEQFNLTRFSLFFPEKRIFFQEKADVFDFSFNSYDNLFYSRNIGLYEGSPVRIYGGVRMTGRIGEWDIGLLDMQTERFNELPSENFGILRTKRRVLNQKSYVGAIITSRIGTEGTYNLAYAVDSRCLLFGDDYLTVKWAQTFNDGAENKAFSIKPAHAYLKWERKRIKGFNYRFFLDWSGENYNPGIGLETRNDFFLKSATLLYGWLPGKDSPLNSHQIYTENNVYHNSIDGSIESILSYTGWSFVTKKTTEGKIYLTWDLEDLKETFYIVDPDVFVPAGRYNFFSILGNLYTTLPDRSLGLKLILEAGTFYDGNKISVSFQPSLNAGSSVIISGNYQMDRINFNNRNQKYTNNIFGLKGTFMFTTKLTFTTYIQYNTFSDIIITNARIRYNAREGSDFYIVYNEGIDSSIKANFLTDQEKENRTILLKYTYTFAF